MRNKVNQLFMQRITHNGNTFSVMHGSNGKQTLVCLLPRLTNYNAPSIKQVNQLINTGSLEI